MIRQGQNRGFTLLELMVAMVLVSMVTTIIATAFRMGINAWNRAEKEGDTFQARSVIPNLLGKQLGALVKQKVFGNGQPPKPLVFTGRSNGLSFFTTYTPMAGSQSGLLRVTYLHDTESGTLSMYQQLILSSDDLAETRSPLSDQWNGETEPSGNIRNVVGFRVGYSKAKGYDRSVEAEPKTEWQASKPDQYPGAVRLEIRYKAPGIDSKPELWHFTVGN